MTQAQLMAATGLLAFTLVLPPLISVIRTDGLKVAFGNRGDISPFPDWANRAVRAQRNMIDTLVPFIAIVVAVQMAGVANENTAFGMALFFWSRVAHAIIYIAGIPYLRTVAFVGSLSGMFRIMREVVPMDLF